MLHELMRRLEEWWIVHRGIARLSHYDDRLLADIGIKRDEISRFVRGELRLDAPADQTVPAFIVGSPHPRIQRRRRTAGRARQLPAAQRRRAQF